MRVPDHRLIVALLCVSIITVSGCVGGNPGAAGGQQPDTQSPTETLTNSGTDDTAPRAELLRFSRLKDECAASTREEWNSSIATDPTTDGERIALNRTIRRTNTDARLDASLSSNDSNATTWTLHITSHDNDTEIEACTGRINYRAAIVVNDTENYNITIRHNGNWSGYVYGTKHGGGGGGIVRASVPQKNTTTTASGS